MPGADERVSASSRLAHVSGRAPDAEPGGADGSGAGRFATLRKLARQATEASNAAQERCELCSEPIAQAHRHLIEVATREVRCVCYPCSVLFDRQAASNGRLKLIPDRHLYLASFVLTDAQWERLRVPVGIAFFFFSTPAGQPVAFYPSPMGATQALLEREVWDDVERQNPVLRSLEPDVEAVLVNRSRSSRDHYLVPIDDCYRLVGVIRTTWRGLTGGKDVWQAIEAFFATLQARSKTLKEDTV